MIITSNKKISQHLNVPLWDGNSSGLLQYKIAIASREFAAYLLSIDVPNLRYIQLTSAGYEGIDLNVAKSKGVIVCNAANVYNIGMAEFVVYAMLMHAKRYHRSIKNRCIRPFRNYHYITELAGKTVGVLGAGNIGSQIAKRLQAFDMRVLGYDLRTDDRPYFEKIFNNEYLTEFLGQCDYIVNCMPLIPSTEGLLSKKWFSNMKPTVTFINVGRKKLINDYDFLCFLKSHKDSTAILDMFEKLPNPITNPYRRLPNVLVLPGVTAISQEIDEKLLALCKTNIEKFYNGKELLNVITR